MHCKYLVYTTAAALIEAAPITYHGLQSREVGHLRTNDSSSQQEFFLEIFVKFHLRGGLLFLFCKFKPSVFQVPSCCSIWLSSWI